jgi:hypothetical protein
LLNNRPHKNQTVKPAITSPGSTYFIKTKKLCVIASHPHIRFPYATAGAKIDQIPAFGTSNILPVFRLQDRGTAPAWAGNPDVRLPNLSQWCLFQISFWPKLLNRFEYENFYTPGLLFIPSDDLVLDRMVFWISGSFRLENREWNALTASGIAQPEAVDSHNWEIYWQIFYSLVSSATAKTASRKCLRVAGKG